MKSLLDAPAANRHMSASTRARTNPPRPEAVDVLLVLDRSRPRDGAVLGLSLLKAGLAPLGVSARVLYLTLRFAERLGVGLHADRDRRGRSASSRAAHVFPRGPLRSRPGRRRAGSATSSSRGRAGPRGARPSVPASFCDRAVRRARSLAGPFLERALPGSSRTGRASSTTSVFQQHVASSRSRGGSRPPRGDRRRPRRRANCEGVWRPGPLRRYDPFLDAVVSGEEATSCSRTVRRALAGRALDDLPGVATPANAGALFSSGRFPNTPSVTRMDDLPVPDDSDYFEQFERSRFAGTWTPGLFLEQPAAARGAACTFCGLNPGRRWRSGDPTRALAELRDVTSRHPGATCRSSTTSSTRTTSNRSSPSSRCRPRPHPSSGR